MSRIELFPKRQTVTPAQRSRHTERVQKLIELGHVGQCQVPWCHKLEHFSNLCTKHYQRDRNNDEWDSVIHSHRDCKVCGDDFEYPAGKRRSMCNSCRFPKCEECGDWFRRDGADDNSRFCSRECHHEFMRDYYKCRGCGDVFRTPRRNSTKQFCSRECALDNHDLWRGDDTERVRIRVEDGEEIPEQIKHQPRLQVTSELRERVGERDDWTCGICGATVDSWLDPNDKLGPTIDHIKPLSRDGSNHLSNLQIAHRKCNNLKGPLY